MMEILKISPEFAERQFKWVIGAFKIAVHHAGFSHTLHGLGRLDCALLTAHKPYHSFLSGDKEIGGSYEGMMDFPCLSNLWTMGMYEVLRTLNQKLNENPEFGESHQITLDTQQLKKKFARVRMPLAKFEAAAQTKDYDYLFITGGGPEEWGWSIGNGTFIYRNDLSDEVLDLFDKFPDNEISLGLKKTIKKNKRISYV